MDWPLARFALISSVFALLVGCNPQNDLPATQSMPTEVRFEWPTEIIPATSIGATETAPTGVPDPISTPDQPTHPCSLVDAVGELTVEYSHADAGNFVLQAGDLITLVWEDAPEGAPRYEFVLLNLDSQPPEPLGDDRDWSDGVSIQWQVPENLTDRVASAIAYFDDGSEIRSRCFGRLWSGLAPPEGQCSLSALTAVRVFEDQDPESEVIGDLFPGIYAAVYERSRDGWYLIDASDLYPPDDQNEIGWVTERQPVRLHGPCENVPTAAD